MGLTDDLFFKTIRQIVSSGAVAGRLHDPYAQNAWVYRAIRSHVQNINGVPLILKKGDRDDSETVLDGDLVNLFGAPNPRQTGTDLMEATIVGLDLFGEFFWIKDSLDDKGYIPGTMPRELWPVDPRKMTEVINRGRNMVLGWIYDAGGGERLTFDAEQVVHFKFHDPNNPWRGLSPLRAGFADVEGDHMAALYNRAFFKNGARLAGVLSTEKGLSDEHRRRELKAFRDSYTGPDKAYRVALLGRGVQFTESKATHKDMEYGDGRRWSREVVGAIFGTPKFEMGVYEDMNFATMEAGKKWYWENTLLPFASYLEQVINGHQLLGMIRDAITGSLFFEYDRDSIKALREAVESRIKSASDMFKNLGVPLRVLNEMFDLGLPVEDIPHADRSFLPVGLMPVGDDGEPKSEPRTPPKDEDKKEGKDDDKDKAQSLVVRRDRGKHIQLGVTARPSEAARVIKDRRSTVSAMLNEDAKSLERAWEPKVRRWMFSVRKSVLRAFDALIAERVEATVDTSSTSFQPVVADSWPPVEKNSPVTLEDLASLLTGRTRWEAEIAKLAHPLYLRVAEATTKTTAAELGGSFSFFGGAQDADVIDFIARRAPKLAEGATSTLAKGVRSALLKGLSENETPEDLRRRIASTFNLSAKRATTIARTETGIAQNSVRFIAHRKEGISSHTWTTSRDGFVRDDPAGNTALTANHVVLEGETVKIGDTFSNGMLYPQEPGAPAVHVVNCRCNAVAEITLDDI